MNSAVIIHAILAVVEIVAYVVLTATGHDGNIVFAIMGGQAIGGGIQAKTGGNNIPPVAPPRSTI